MPVKDAIASVLNRNAFYRDGYRTLVKISLIQTAVIAVLILSIIVLVISMKPHPVYFATTSDGRIINVVPVSEPYKSQADLVAWAAQTSQNVMRFGYHDYRDRLQQASSNFTTTGWDSFNKALKDSHFLEAILAHKQVITLEINAAPEIQSAGVRGGVYTWYVQFPVTIKFDADQPSQPQQLMLHLQIVRVSTLQNPDGISIEQWILTAKDAPR